MKASFTFALLLCLTWTNIIAEDNILPLIPKPVSLKEKHGKFLLTGNTVIIAKPDIEEAKYLLSVFGLKQQLKKSKTGNSIIINIHPSDKPEKQESYSLKVNSRKAIIDAYSGAGCFYGIQTLLQLLEKDENNHLYIPCVKIKDQPQFKWRGMHLDCCRHFFSKEEVKKYIDYLAAYKFNTFHWHLTDDQGWRIEIKQYPLLTSISSMRKETVVGHTKDTGNVFDGKPYGGFYTQEDIKEIVAYATGRHITIVPEIEMPGHAVAALSAYPQYSCKGGPFQPLTVWGVSEDVYCPGNDSTFIFLQNILSEVCALFPGQYIHIGGDECPKDRWKTCSKCQARIRAEHLKNEEELQSYFVKRMEDFLATKGKHTIGWDEIMEGGLPEGAIVMSWRGVAGGIAAAKQKHYAVMTPGKPCYFDHYQVKNRDGEPLAIGGYNPLINVYNYNPVPDTLTSTEKQYILGAQANVWTEYIPSFSQVEYMIFPRMCALSEVLWDKNKKKNYKDFLGRLKMRAKDLDTEKINYCKSFLQDKSE